MINHDWSAFWWNNITGANYVVQQVATALMENMTAIIEVPSDLPWRKEMRSAVETSYRDQASVDAMIEIIDAADECDPETSPGKFLLQQYGQSREIKNGYRDRSGKSLQQYLKEKAVLKNRIIWVKGLSGKQAEDWVKFCREFDPETPEKGLFVLEIHGEFSKLGGKTLRFISFLKHVSSYDVQLFNSFILDKKKTLNANWKQYLATAAASLCETDAEISSLLLQGEKLKEISLLEKIDEIAEELIYSARGGEEDSTHVLAYARKNNRAELEHRLWKAQIQTLFPYIEMERVSIIESNKAELQQALSHSHVEQYKNRVTEPVDVELGTLCYLLTVNSVYMPNRDDRERVFFLHECRNLLAHARCCSEEQICRLFDESLN